MQKDDVIYRQEAIDEAREWIDAVYFEDDDELVRKAIWQVIGSLKNMPSAQPEQRWIPVTERLPEPNKIEENGCLRYYLTQNEYGDMMVCSWNGFKWEQIYQLEPTDYEIVAWMPKPKPYKGGSE